MCTEAGRPYYLGRFVKISDGNESHSIIFPKFADHDHSLWRVLTRSKPVDQLIRGKQLGQACKMVHVQWPVLEPHNARVSALDVL